jgi:hypothetical protein
MNTQYLTLLDSLILAALTDKSPTSFQALLAGGVNISTINEVGKTISSPDFEAKCIQVREWCSLYPSTQNRISQFACTLLQITDRHSASRCLEIYLSAGGNLKDIPLTDSAEHQTSYLDILLDLQPNSPEIKDQLNDLLNEMRNNPSTMLEIIKKDRQDLLNFLVVREKLNLADQDGNSLLHHACRFKASDSIRYLLDTGADFHLKNHKGMTPLHYCGAVGDIQNAQLLISLGADPVALDSYGETPFSLPLTCGNKRAIASLFAKWPKIQEASRTCLMGKDIKQLINNRPGEVLSESPRLEVPFLLQNVILIQAIARSLSIENYRHELAALRSLYPGASFVQLENARLTINLRHILDFESLKQYALPSKETLATVDLQNLLSLFDQLNLSRPDQKNYRDPESIKDANGRCYSGDTLREKLSTLIQDITNRIPKAGAPPMNAEVSQALFHSAYETLPENLKITLKDPFAQIEQFLDPKQPASGLKGISSALKESLDKQSFAALQPELEKMKRLDRWFQCLEDTTKAIVLILQEEKIDDAAPTILELSLIGGNCGGWYMGDIPKIHQQKMSCPKDFRLQVLAVLHQQFLRIAESMVDRSDDQNQHQLTRILKEIDNLSGISKEDAARRPHFQDPLPSPEGNTVQILEQFKKRYSPGTVIQAIDEAINGTTSGISKELAVDWFKEHIPNDWEREQFEDSRSYSYLEHFVYDLPTGKITKKAVIEMLISLGILSL